MVRRRGGGTSRRYLAPTTWTPLVQNPAVDTYQITCDTSRLPRMRGMWQGKANTAIDGSRNGIVG